MGADRSRHRTRLGQAVAVLMALSAFMAGGAGATAAASGTWSQAVDLPLPPNASTTGFIAKSPAVSCPASGTCVAVSQYEDSSGGGQAMAVNESGGVWGGATQITTLPPNAATTGLFSSLESVSCPVSGSCTAVGWYIDSAAKEQMMAVSETSGAWNQASEIALPANAAANPHAHLVSVSCPVVGSCVAIGSYADSSEKMQMMATTESGGVWSGASQIPLPAAATSWELSSVSCSAPESCVAVGLYHDGSSISRTMAITDTGGSWGQAAEVTLPANAATGASTRARLTSASCPATGACVAVGNYTTTSGIVEAMIASEASGSWQPATEIPPPANTFSAPEASFASVSCRSAGSCVTAGSYGEPSAYLSAMVVTESDGFWGAASQITAPPPEPPTGEPASTLLSSVACPATESCVAVGLYHEESSGITRAMAVSEVSSPSGEKDEVLKGGGSPLPSGGSTTTTPGTTPPPAKTATVALASSTATLTGDNMATLKLTCTGATPCLGKLTLTVKRANRKARKAASTVTIGSGSFSIPAGKSGIIRVKLNAMGRALLNAAHGRLEATLTILTSSLTPASKQTKGIRLMQAEAAKGKRK